MKDRPHTRDFDWTLLAVAMAICGLGLAAAAGLGPSIALAPLAVGLWWLAALGLRELMTAMGRKPALQSDASTWRQVMVSMALLRRLRRLAVARSP